MAVHRSDGGIAADYKKRRAGVDLTRSAIDKGHTLDCLLIEKLTADERNNEQLNPASGAAAYESAKTARGRFVIAGRDSLCLVVFSLPYSTDIPRTFIIANQTVKPAEEPIAWLRTRAQRPVGDRRAVAVET